jgi:hypothetical protein
LHSELNKEVVIPCPRHARLPLRESLGWRRFPWLEGTAAYVGGFLKLFEDIAMSDISAPDTSRPDIPAVPSPDIPAVPDPDIPAPEPGLRPPEPTEPPGDDVPKVG